MTITEFLLARITEDEQQAEACRELGWVPAKKYGLTAIGYSRTLAECAAKRAIIKQHEQWPVLVERKPSELEIANQGLESITYRMTSEMAWLTTKEYIRRFGSEPPTAPMLLTLAAVYKDHPDYQEEWAA